MSFSTWTEAQLRDAEFSLTSNLLVIQQDIDKASHPDERALHTRTLATTERLLAAVRAELEHRQTDDIEGSPFYALHLPASGEWGMYHKRDAPANDLLFAVCGTRKEASEVIKRLNTSTVTKGTTTAVVSTSTVTKGTN